MKLICEILNPNSNYKEVTNPYDKNKGLPIENVRPAFLTRRNTGRYVFDQFSSTAKDGFVGVPVEDSNGNYFNYEVVDHPFIKSAGGGNFNFDTGSEIYTKSLGTYTDNDNTTLLPPAINPRNARFLGYSVELELSKKVSIDPSINPSGDKPFIITRK